MVCYSVLIGVFLYISLCLAQKGKGKEKSFVREDLPYVACEVCQNVVDEVYHLASLAKSTAPYQKLEEIQVLDILDDICDVESKRGSWLKEVDIIEEKKQGNTVLKIVRPGGKSKCNEECLTVQKSCQILLDDELDRDDLSVLFWRNSTSLVGMRDKICQKMVKRCKGKNKYLPSNFKRVDFPFEAMSDKDAQMEELMAEMKKAGLGGMNMYNRDDMASMMPEDGYESEYGLEGDHDDGSSEF